MACDGAGGAGPGHVLLLGGRVPAAADLADRAALDGLLERVTEAQGTPVLAAELVADLAAVHLTLLPEEVLDQRDLAVEPPLVLVLVDARGRRERGVARRAHRSPPLGRVLDAVSCVAPSCSPLREKRGACAVPRPSSRPTVYGSASSPGSSISSCWAESGGAMSSRSRCADSTPIVACTMPPKIITIAPMR